MDRMIDYLRIQRIKTILFFVVLYLVGLAGLTNPLTHDFFLGATPLILLGNFTAILLFHQPVINHSTRWTFVLIFLVCLAIEMVGVATQKVFGSYVYGDALGIKLFNVPLMIGVNWVMVTYCSASIAEWTRKSKSVQVVLAATIMVIYDMIMEQVAPYLDMWYWNGKTIPLRNYIIWFLLGLVFVGYMKYKRVSTINPIAPAILICQICFFLLIRFLVPLL